jgi:hypothetical protein
MEGGWKLRVARANKVLWLLWVFQFLSDNPELSRIFVNSPQVLFSIIDYGMFPVDAVVFA